MTWIAVLLIGVAVADLAHSIRPVPVVNECTGAAVAVWVGLAAGLTDLADLVALARDRRARRAVGPDRDAGVLPRPGWGPPGSRCSCSAAASALALLCSAVGRSRRRPAGRVARRHAGAGPRAGSPTDRALLLAGVFLVQLSTGNVVVRLVLSATDTVNPALHDTPEDPEHRLKGGRLLGPMERVLIVGLGLAGQLTAASIVIAAKGLLRWPELQSKTEQQWIHRLTEYFLVGSFVSWLVALGGLVLLAR